MLKGFSSQGICHNPHLLFGVHQFTGSHASEPVSESQENQHKDAKQNDFYFYQASSGQWVFIHPLLMRILLNYFGSYNSLPSTLQGTILELEPQTQTEILRKRQKYLGHLPLGGEKFLICSMHEHLKVC